MKRDARIAGILYILLGVIAPVRLIYIPNAVLVSGNAQATAASIASHEAIFRVAILTDMLAGVLSLLVAMALFRLFRTVDRDLSLLMFFLGGGLVTSIYFFNLVNDAAALVVARAPTYLAAFDQPQRDGLVSLFLRMHRYGVIVNEMFWGLWLFPLGGLILKSRIMPRFVAYWLFLNGAAYVLLCVLGVLAPSLEARVTDLMFPAQAAEIVVMLWLAFGRLQTDSLLAAEH